MTRRAHLGTPSSAESHCHADLRCCLSRRCWLVNEGKPITEQHGLAIERATCELQLADRLYDRGLVLGPRRCGRTPRDPCVHNLALGIYTTARIVGPSIWKCSPGLGRGRAS